jgi:hypothetical protein
VHPDYYHNCLAFARRGHTMYFPVVFSRYNPAIIARHARAMGITGKRRKWLASPDTVTQDTGQFRDYGFGMVAMFAGDARAAGGFDAGIEGWGGEDVDFHGRALARGYMVWRMYDPAAVHDYHGKDCTGLRGTSRHTQCLASKYKQEGNQLQLAVALARKRSSKCP